MSQFETLMGSKAAMFGLAIVAFLIAALLVLLIVRMLFGGRLRMPGGRARQARLGIVDAFDLDRQRQLIIVRRDNTEHLIMIGGPNDILIESEIVRVEARDFRDGRRDVSADARIPAPVPPSQIPQPPILQSPITLDRPELKLPDPPPRPIVDEPMLPMSLPVPPAPPAPSLSIEPPPVEPPQAPSLSIEPPPARAPTFPLPPRRPMPTPERRPTPPPPRLPDSVSRADDTAPVITGLGPGPAPDAPPPLAPPPLAPPISAPARTAPPFIKPLTPRPPLRPLQRTTPQPPAAPPPAPPPVAGPAVEAPPKVAPPPQVVAPPPPPAPPAPPPAPEPIDALESLEEEMAKLLGRDPG